MTTFIDVPLPEMPEPPVPPAHETGPPGRCAWCEASFGPGVRRDSITCSKRCRQARWRFLRAVGRGRAGREPLRLAYADPPYPGLSLKYYGGHPDFAGEVDHAELVRYLSTFDGWALSTSARALPAVLALCPADVRVAAWVRGERPTKAYGPLNAWEPVIFHGGRGVVEDHGDGSRRVDALVHGVTARSTDPRRVVGTKPAQFCRWVFDLLGAQPQDHFTDVFPGSGGVQRAWDAYASSVDRATAPA